jgi:DNA-binding XRE family transcriptional regulator
MLRRWQRAVDWTHSIFPVYRDAAVRVPLAPTPMTNENFAGLIGSRLKEARKALGLTQAQVAKMTGITVKHWGRLERGVAIPGGQILSELVRLGVDANWAAAGFKDTLVRWKMKPEVVHGETKDIQPRIQARGG